jgi:hypothetical protein
MCPNSKSNTQVQALLSLCLQKAMYLGTLLDIYLVKLSTRGMPRNPHPHSKNSTLQMMAW